MLANNTNKILAAAAADVAVAKPQADEIEADLLAKLAEAEAAVDVETAAVAAHDAAWKPAYAELAQLSAAQMFWTPDEAIIKLARMSGLQAFLGSHTTVLNAKLADVRRAQVKKDFAQTALHHYRVGRQARREEEARKEAQRAALLTQLAALDVAGATN